MQIDEMNLSELSNVLSLKMAEFEKAAKRLQAARATAKTKFRKAAPPKNQKRKADALGDLLTEKQRRDLDDTLALLRNYRGDQ